ncbi:MAG: cobalamin biosynthesis protein [Firmicutes bacterium]|nr:cobalamin biosynthesis protein [Bacillota bacterium]MCL5015236.1 cobalamin biosynthesis protein [Bacillota bacterium]
MEKREKWAAVVITRPGWDQVRLLHRYRTMTVWLPKRFHDSGLLADEEVRYYAKPLSQWVREVFHDYDHWIFVMSVSLATRLIAPVIRDKHRDPSVTVVDDGGHYAVCLLSCHAQDGNEITRDIARILQAMPVITTGSESLEVPALDLIGREGNWHLEDWATLSHLSRMMLEKDPVGVVQESGSPCWRYRDSFSRIYDGWEYVPAPVFQEIRGWLWITHRRVSVPRQVEQTPILVYRPKVLSIGVGFSRNTTVEDLEEMVSETLNTNHLSSHSVDTIVTIDRKRGDGALEEWAQRHGWKLQFVSPEELNRVPLNHRHFNPSVLEATGAYAVSEPAAILGADGGPLLVSKCKSDRVTVAVALKTAASRSWEPENDSR